MIRRSHENKSPKELENINLRRKEAWTKYNNANKESHREYYIRNSERIKARIGAKSKTPEGRMKRNAYLLMKKNTDVQFRILKSLRCSMGNVVRRRAGVVSKSAKTTELLGCTIEEARDWLEMLWEPGMSWSNYGRKGWHIDHVEPCSSFDLSDPSQQRKCFHFSNLSPLWWYDNLSKHSKVYC